MTIFSNKKEKGKRKWKGQKAQWKFKSEKAGKKTVKVKSEVLAKAKSKRVNWSKGSPRNKMKGFLNKYDRKDKKLQLEGQSESWTIGKLDKERDY